MNTKRGISSIIIGLALVAAVAGTAVAGEGRTPIWRPTSIGTPGKYVVTRNISDPGTIIEITVDGVEIDLNGMVLEGLGPDPVITNSPGTGNIAIRNGQIRGSGGDAIALLDGRGYTLEDLEISDGGGGGAVIFGTEVAIRRLDVADRGGPAILVDAGPFLAASGVVADSVIFQCADGIVVERPSSFTIRNNEIERTFGAVGIRAAFGRGVLISENTVEDAPGEGIMVEGVQHCKVYNNVVTGSGAAGLAPGHGISLLPGSDSCLVLDNVSSGNMGSGLFVAGIVNHLENNVLNLNGAGGLVFAPGGDGNTYGRNTGRFNAPPVAPCAIPTPCAPGADICDDGGAGIGNTSRFDNVFGPGVC